MTLRVHAYIDGLNLFHNSPPHLRRCNVRKLVELFLLGREDLQSVNYYTTHPTHRDEPTRTAHTAYTTALQRRDITIVAGQFKSRETRIHAPATATHPAQIFIHKTHEEKETDVNIAIDMLCDAYDNKCDKLMLVSGDSDLIPAIKRIVKIAPHQKIVVLAPPDQPLTELKKLMKHPTYRRALNLAKLTPTRIAAAQLP